MMSHEKNQTVSLKCLVLQFPHLQSRNINDRGLETSPTTEQRPNFYFCRIGDSFNPRCDSNPEEMGEESTEPSLPTQQGHSTLSRVHSSRTASPEFDFTQSISNFLD